MRIYYILAFFFFAVSSSIAQQKYTISGFIEDADSGEKLIAANVLIVNH